MSSPPRTPSSSLDRATSPAARRSRRGAGALLGLLLAAPGGPGLPGQEVAGDAPSAAPPTTEILYLSGSGHGDRTLWDFEIDAGQRAGEAARIAVPSQWEQEGFGRYAYGRTDEKPAETGRYRTQIDLPEAWFEAPARRLRLVFGGVMTDASVHLNGTHIGTHRGGFTQFSFAIDGAASPGKNHLEVVVSEESADASVNRAERDADYWTFGGIFRPVWIEARPAESLRHVAVDARHEGSLRARVETDGATGCSVSLTLGSDAAPFARAEVGVGPTHVAAHVPAVVPWSAETPRLYDLHVDLLCDGEVVHRVTERIGFRTVEVRPGEGLFVNGRRTVLRGINRHSFWPETGRTLTDEQNWDDVRLLRSLHFNAVRSSHYPPDRAFLDACDELGLYVLDELPGWQDAYSTRAGTPLVGELVRRDVNHPSVIAWNNGNEDGWNTSLDALFRRHDIQGRPVLHPRGRFGGFETEHYMSYRELQRKIHEKTRLLLLPTELLHGLYDGGGGASLEDYWTAMESTPRFAGGFLWALLDEAVLRTDEGVLDAFGNYAPDGVVGPYRELEPSAATIRSLFAPVQFEALQETPRAARVRVRSQMHHARLGGATVEWAWIEAEDDAEVARTEGALEMAPLDPGASGHLELPAAPTAASFLRLRVRDASGRALGERSFAPKRARRQHLATLRDTPARLAEPRDPADPDGAPSAEQTGHEIVLARGTTKAVFSASTGALVRLERGGQTLELDVGAAALFAAGSAPARLLGSEIEASAQSARVRFGFEGPLHAATWTLRGDALHAQLLVHTGVPTELVGVRLLDPSSEPADAVWEGQGPWPVWRNRRRGPEWGVWHHARDAQSRGGFFGPAASARIALQGGHLRIGLPDAETYLGLGRAEMPDDAMKARAPTTEGVVVLSHIPAIGTKFHTPEELGPSGAATAPPGLHRVRFTLRLEP